MLMHLQLYIIYILFIEILILLVWESICLGNNKEDLVTSLVDVYPWSGNNQFFQKIHFRRRKPLILCG